ncbi:MAG: preprotein translocase subunit SecA [Bacteroidales bacterium]|nr:preprotein translocase subunit SecA [Bacteroidales bacterium]
MSFFNNVVKGFVKSKSERDFTELQPRVLEIIEAYKKLSSLSNDELRARSQAIKQEIQNSYKATEEQIEALKIEAEEEKTPFEKRGELYQEVEKLEKKVNEQIETSLDKFLPEVFAIMKDTARRFFENETLEVSATDFDRHLAVKKDFVEIQGNQAIYKNHWMAGGNEITWDMIHYDVQLMGGIVLHQGRIAEMATGEGKTLVATLSVFLNAMAGKGVHLVTVNNYLAKRDAEWMGPLYEFHGLSVDCIDYHQPNSEERRQAYMADITFGTNNEFGFDYLRDNMSIRPVDLVQRKHHYTIVDEVDSVLIDDARTPLIISGPIPKGDDQLFKDYKNLVEKLFRTQRDLTNHLLSKSKTLLKEGKTKEGGFHLLQSHKGLPKNKALIKFLSEEGIKALLLKTEGIYMQDNMKRMHEATDDLFFVIDEKNNSVELTDKGIELISKDVDNKDFFVMPDVGLEVANIEALEIEDKEKLKKKDKLLSDFAVKSERIHTVNQLLKAYTLFEREVEYVVMDNAVKIVDEQTGRILEGRRYSDGLHQAIEAKENVKIEAATQTFATITLQNYFRMYHKLAGMTGTAETEAGELWDIYKLDVVVTPTNRPIVRNDFEDLVYKTKREKYNAVIDEISRLIEAGRPVLVGTTTVEVSELLSRMLKLRKIEHNVLNAKYHQREAEIVAIAGQSSKVTIATNMAGRGTDIKLSEAVRQAGGLAIVGTERHESRRVDRQLRGRAGRQGDPGTSQFFVSLEDNLMRLFGSDRISKMMDRLGLKEGEVIQHSMISKSIERAQRKVEENNFGIRKRLLEYDDVMNSQREVIYSKRKHALLGERIQVEINNILYDVVEEIIQANHPESDFENFKLDLLRFLSVETHLTEEEFLKIDPAEIVSQTFERLEKVYHRKTEGIAQQAFPVIKHVYDTQKHAYENIVVPISDGKKIFQVVTHLETAFNNEAKEVVKSFEKIALLVTIDEVWKEHLRQMDELKQSVQNASYEQKDPLLIYKFEAFELFNSMLINMNKKIASSLMKGHIFLEDENKVKQAAPIQKLDLSKYETSRQDEELASGGDPSQQPQQQPRQKIQPIRTEKKVGRNDPCPCGSGKKYKNCCGKGVV